jgi:hypothetical protein
VCRHCHNVEKDHQINRYATKTMVHARTTTSTVCVCVCVCVCDQSDKKNSRRCVVCAHTCALVYSIVWCAERYRPRVRRACRRCVKGSTWPSTTAACATSGTTRPARASSTAPYAATQPNPTLSLFPIAHVCGVCVCGCACAVLN